MQRINWFGEFQKNLKVLEDTIDRVSNLKLFQECYSYEKIRKDLVKKGGNI